uniref:homocysteine S-methyltransferase 1-like n=1 Tax=Styela clava TaxID=7725 RepID=UPI00193A80D9|nr:homocysteine S-methyltransferase 1-like [Styela clava]
MSVVKVLDGGLGTDLEKAQSIDFLADDPLFSARFLHTDPSAVKDAHKRFLLAGSDAVITSSYQASIDGFMKNCNVSREDAIQLLQLSVDVAKDSIQEVKSQLGDEAKEKYYVAASIGPYGACQHDMSEYTGHYVDNMSEDDLKNWHRERLSILLGRDPDFIAIETMPAQKEAQAIIELLREFPQAKAWVTFTCKDEEHTYHGDKFKEAFEKISKCPQIKSIGINCCHPKVVEPIMKSIRHLLQPDKTFIAYPNANLVLDETTRRMFTEPSSQSLTDYVSNWLSIGGIEWIGGCCLVTPDDITNISKVVNDWNSRNVE